jgi:cullin-associated NEDD8-dissociated protein 1
MLTSTLQAAYEALYTLLPHPTVPSTTVPSLLPPLRAGLADEGEIRLLALLSLHKAIETHPGTMAPLLPSFIEAFSKVLAQKPREAAVKQEVERMDEGIRGVIRLGLDVQRRWPEGVGAEWATWWAEVKTEQGPVIKTVEAEGQAER